MSLSQRILQLGAAVAAQINALRAQIDALPAGGSSEVPPYRHMSAAQSNGAGDAIYGEAGWTNTAATGTSAPLNATTVQGRYQRTSWQNNTASATLVVGRMNGAKPQMSRRSGFDVHMRFGRGLPAANTPNLRAAIGVAGWVVAPPNANWSTTVTDFVGIVADSGDANYQIYTSRGANSGTKVNTGFSKSLQDQMFDLRIVCQPGADSVYIKLTRLNDGAVFEHTATNAIALPAVATNLNNGLFYGTGGTSSTLGLLFCFCRTVYLS
jgi:hypothetical protein